MVEDVGIYYAKCNCGGKGKIMQTIVSVMGKV